MKKGDWIYLSKDIYITGYQQRRLGLPNHILFFKNIPYKIHEINKSTLHLKLPKAINHKYSGRVEAWVIRNIPKRTHLCEDQQMCEVLYGRE